MVGSCCVGNKTHYKKCVFTENVMKIVANFRDEVVTIAVTFRE